MKNQNTPGPWAFREGSAPHFQSLVYREETGEDIAVVYHDEAGHDARLIAAAPQLLEALREVEKNVMILAGIRDKDQLGTWK